MSQVNEQEIFIVPVTWEMYGYVAVSAANAADAITLVNRNIHDIDLPEDKNYIANSFKITNGTGKEEIEMCTKLYKNKQLNLIPDYYCKGEE